MLAAGVDGTLPRANIFGALWNLIPQTRQAARAAGMLADPDTGQFGEAPAQQILDALDKIQQMHSQATVRVAAARDTFVAEPLVIEIEVTPAKAESTGD